MKVKFIIALSLLGAYLPVLADNRVRLSTCGWVYEACLKDTGLPSDQILMGARGICKDQQMLCDNFHKQLQDCLADFGQKACTRIIKNSIGNVSASS